MPVLDRASERSLWSLRVDGWMALLRVTRGTACAYSHAKTCACTYIHACIHLHTCIHEHRCTGEHVSTLRHTHRHALRACLYDLTQQLNPRTNCSRTNLRLEQLFFLEENGLSANPKLIDKYVIGMYFINTVSARSNRARTQGEVQRVWDAGL
eukprot:1754750-Rhodomonas_salina.5